MKRSTGVLLLIAALAGRAGAEEPLTARDQARAVLAQRSAAGQILEDLRGRADTQRWDTAVLMERLADRMVKEAPQHRRPADSLRQCRTLVEQMQRAAMEDDLAQAIAAAQARSPTPIRREAVLEWIGTSWEDQVTATLDRFLAQQLDPVFKGARQRAVARQQQEALAALRFPEAAQLDERLLARWRERKDAKALLESRDFDALGGWLAGFAAPKPETLLEEVERALREAAAGRKDTLRREYEAQLAAARHRVDAVPPACLTADALARELISAVETDVRARGEHAPAGTPAYPVFQVVRSNVWAFAEQLESERLGRGLDQLGQPKVDAGSLQKQMEKDSGLYRRKAESEQRLLVDMTAARRTEAAAALARAAAAPDAERAALEARLGGENPAANLFQERLRTAVAAAHAAARERVVEGQWKTTLAFLDEVEPLGEPVLAKVQARAGKPLSTLAEALDLLRADPEKPAPPVDIALLLEETESRALALAATAVANAQKALDEQAALVRDLEARQRDQLARDVAADRPVDRLLKEWTQQFSREWKARASGAGLAYDEPLAATLDLLNKTVRQLYDAQKKEQEALAAAAATGTPAPGPAAVSPAERQRDEEDEQKDKAEALQHTVEEVLLVPCDASLVIRDVDASTCEASLRLDPGVPPVIVRFAPDDPDSAAKALFAALRPALAELVDGRKELWKKGGRSFLGLRRRAAPELRFYMVVRSREIRHQTSLMLRSQIGDLLREWSELHHPEQPVTLDWTVGLGAVTGPE